MGQRIFSRIKLEWRTYKHCKAWVLESECSCFGGPCADPIKQTLSKSTSVSMSRTVEDALSLKFGGMSVSEKIITSLGINIQQTKIKEYTSPPFNNDIHSCYNQNIHSRECGDLYLIDIYKDDSFFGGTFGRSWRYLGFASYFHPERIDYGYMAIFSPECCPTVFPDPVVIADPEIMTPYERSVIAAHVLARLDAKKIADAQVEKQ